MNNFTDSYSVLQEKGTILTQPYEKNLTFNHFKVFIWRENYSRFFYVCIYFLYFRKFWALHLQDNRKSQILKKNEMK